MQKLFAIVICLCFLVMQSFAQSKQGPCEQTVKYSVDESLLHEKHGKLPVPTTNPSFIDGSEKFKNYFVAHPLTDDRAKDIVFRVIIGFQVNCNGQAANFEIITKGQGRLLELAGQVKNIVQEMPQQWKPATVDSTAVNCYQAISFTVFQGSLEKASYR